ncbi:MAG: fibronectin type III domain-containing protein [Chloroflexi bacterium]|nr:fibronectin type III domain-containing protein [Chloroflexota bacterium]
MGLTKVQPAHDTAGPVISGVDVSNVTKDSAMIKWATNENSTGWAILCTSTGNCSTSEIEASGGTEHRRTLMGLKGDTRYQLTVCARDASGNESKKEAFYFTTLPFPDTVKPAISKVNYTIIDYDRVSVTWSTDEPATSQAQYMESTNITNTRIECKRKPWGDKCLADCDQLPDSVDPVFLSDYGATSFDSKLVNAHNVIMQPLLKGKAYKFRVISKDAAGNERVSDDQVFTMK